MEYRGKVTSDLETNSESKTKKPLDFLRTSRPRTLTCIDVHDIWAFDNLVSKNTIATMLEIMSITNSNFHSVEPIHLPIVQNSMINGKFCPYHAVNPLLNLIRGLEVPIDPIADNKASETFKAKWSSAIKACVNGPVKSNLDPTTLPDDYFKSCQTEDQVGGGDQNGDEDEDGNEDQAREKIAKLEVS